MAVPGHTLCCTPAPYCRLYSRLKFGSRVRLVILPKFGLLLGPISFSCAMLSPLVGRFRPARSVSVHVRVSVNVAIGLNRFANVLTSGVMYLPKFALSAVLPSPNRSYATPRRGDHDDQHVMPGSDAQVIASYDCAGANRPASRCAAGISSFRYSKRRPYVIVNLSTAH